MNTTKNNNSLNSLGTILVAKLLNIKPKGLKFAMVDNDGKSIKVKVQNKLTDEALGNCFTIDVDMKTAAHKILSTDRIIFVDYDDKSLIRVYDCHDHEGYTMKYIGGTRPGDWKRITMCFPIEKMTKLAELNEPAVLAEMKSLSQAKKFNIDSKFYGRY